jgi:EAL domain-containing protein (putative c-di-GMP-specific phosphodiesterase class I)
VSPEKFIPIAEGSNLILDVDRIVVERVCRQVRSWLDRGINVVPIGINISARQASRQDLLDLVEQTISKYSVPAQLIDVEITETSALYDIDTVAKNIRALSKRSVKVALDDFGAGHASLSLLTHCNIDMLKIDKQFVAELDSDRSSKSIIRGIVELARVLDVTSVAEGVENENQYKTLKEIGCDSAQGYFFSRPLDPEKLIEYMNAH